MSYIASIPSLLYVLASFQARTETGIALAQVSISVGNIKSRSHDSQLSSRIVTCMCTPSIQHFITGVCTDNVNESSPEVSALLPT